MSTRPLPRSNRLAGGKVSEPRPPNPPLDPGARLLRGVRDHCHPLDRRRRGIGGAAVTVTYHMDVLQGSDEWEALRRGRLTASEMYKIVTPATLKAAANDKARAHLWELLAQRITKYVEPHFYGDEMARGHDDEIEVRKLYGKHISPVEECGFITNDSFGFTLGYSPDGLIENRTAGIEAKSRRQRFQIQTIVEHHLLGAVPTDYLIQCHTGMIVAELSRMDLVSYSGGLPMIPMKVWPDDKIHAAIIEISGEFERQLAEKLAAYHDALEANPTLIPTERRIEHEMYVGA